MPTSTPDANSAELQSWFRSQWESLSLQKILSVLLLVLTCIVVIRLVTRLLKKVMERSSLDTRVQRTILRAVKTLLYITAVLLLMDSVGFPVTSLVALAGVLGLALSLAVQDVLANVAGGLVLLLSKPFVLGDYVATSDAEGTVEEIGLTHTKLDTPAGQRIMLPNSRLTAGKVVNYSTKGIRRVDHTVTASYDDTTEAVRRACLRAVAETAGVLSDPAPAVLLSSYGESAIAYTVRFWADTDTYWNAYSTSLENIRRCFDEDGITMTYNHLNVHIVGDHGVSSEK